MENFRVNTEIHAKLLFYLDKLPHKQKTEISRRLFPLFLGLNACMQADCHFKSHELIKNNKVISLNC